MWSRIYITPLLQAEEDRDQARRHFADLAREKALLGTQTSAYNSDRYVPAKDPIAHLLPSPADSRSQPIVSHPIDLIKLTITLSKTI